VNNRQRWVITGVRTDDLVGLNLIAVADVSVDRVVVGDQSVGTSAFLRGLVAEFRGGDRK
jgi:hypothetical protein